MKEIIKLALKEDIGSGDITTNSIIPKNRIVKAKIIAKEKGIIAGLGTVKTVFEKANIKFTPKVKSGTNVKKGRTIAIVKGNARKILTLERTALNFLQRLSGVATLTSKYVNEIKGTCAKILDTRKTSPGMREEEKAAVKAGGGYNHRFGLFDAVLIKDNHIAVIKDIKKAVLLAKKKGKVEIEAGNIPQAKKAIEAGADIILLDNMSIKNLKRSVRMIKDNNRTKRSKILIEASGGVDIANVRAIAKTGVDLISVGALTHSSKALDISLELT